MRSRILVLEDNKVMRENIAEILELANYDVITASNGRDGSIMARELNPSLIISDIVMPKLDGYGVLHILSKDPKTSSIPFVFLTSKAERSSWRKGMELGADDYLIKPFEDTELLNTIEVRLKKASSITKKLPLLRERSHVSFESYLQKKSHALFKKREVIFHEGDEAQHLFYIKKGKVKTYKTHDDGKEYITNIYTDGEFFGFQTLFNKDRYLKSALVIESSEIYKIPKDVFLSFMSQDCNMCDHFMKLLSQNIEEREGQLLALAYDSVRKRTARALLKLYDKFSLNNEDSTNISISRENLACMAGTTIETVIRCLGDFKEEQLIKVQGRKITILNNEGLMNIQ